MKKNSENTINYASGNAIVVDIQLDGKAQRLNHFNATKNDKTYEGNYICTVEQCEDNQFKLVFVPLSIDGHIDHTAEQGTISVAVSDITVDALVEEKHAEDAADEAYDRRKCEKFGLEWKSEQTIAREAYEHKLATRRAKMNRALSPYLWADDIHKTNERKDSTEAEIAKVLETGNGVFWLNSEKVLFVDGSIRKIQADYVFGTRSGGYTYNNGGDFNFRGVLFVDAFIKEYMDYDKAKVTKQRRMKRAAVKESIACQAEYLPDKIRREAKSCDDNDAVFDLIP